MEIKTEHRCGFCDRVFRREQTLASHMCEPRRRYQDRDERGVQIGFQGFLEFYRTMHGSAKLKTLDDFDSSPYYRAFVAWGRYCVNTRVIDPDSYMRWLLKQNIKIDHWSRDTQYTEFLIQWLPTENVDQALRRAWDWAEDWAQHNQAPARDCLRYGNTHVLCHAITTGRVSPWIVYNCDSGQQFLASLTDAELAMIWPYIDSDRWQQRFRQYPADQALCQQRLLDLGW